VTLRSAREVRRALREELQERFAAGIVVVDAKLTHLAYAPRIAGDDAAAQQAEAVVAARRKIVQARSACEHRAHGLAERGWCELDDEHRAAMAAPAGVLCSDRVRAGGQPGTLYN
jgi:regulator of protease activity HflC (stomatin/prohibitin superfamily)